MAESGPTRSRADRDVDVVVVGAGITGLTAAWTLARAGIAVTVLDSGARVGGKLHTGTIAGQEVELGADAFLARHGAARALVSRLGMADDLVAPAAGRVWLWTRGRLRPLPHGTVLGAPADLGALARARVLPVGALVRAAMEPLVPRRALAGDRSIADVVGGRFGPAVVDRLVEPLLGGVYAGRPDQLSMDATAPMIAEAARSHRSLLAGLRAHRARQVGATDRPVFETLASGLSRLPERLAADLGDRVRLETPARSLRAVEDGWAVDTPGGTIVAGTVVLAVPAFVASELLVDVARGAAAELAGIRYASVAVVTLAYGGAAQRELPEGSGMLVPRVEGRLVKASTWVSRKWAHRATGEHLLVRASVGRIDDDRWRRLSEDELVARVDAEVRWATGISRPAEHAIVTPWERSLPQYDVGHPERVDRARMRLPAGLELAGAAYDGVGISPCVASAEAAAVRILGS